MPKTSVLVPVFNGEKYLEKTLQSIADNAPDDSEVIVMDDGSTDNSCEIIRKFVDSNPKFVFESNNTGKDVFNALVDKSQAEYIIMFDQVDIFLPGRKDHTVYLDEHPDVTGVYGIAMSLDGQNINFNMGKTFSNFLLFNDNNPCRHGSLTMRRQAVIDADGYIFSSEYEKGDSIEAASWYLIQRLGIIGPLSFIAKPIEIHRFCKENPEKDLAMLKITRNTALERLKNLYQKEVDQFLNEDISSIRSDEFPLYTQVAGLVSVNIQNSGKDVSDALKKTETINKEDWGIKKLWYDHFYNKKELDESTRCILDIATTNMDDLMIQIWVCGQMQNAMSNFPPNSEYTDFIEKIKMHQKFLFEKNRKSPAVVKAVQLYS